ncbi:hypothetical protein S7335_2845 [Synechococcus sp. PCC 7335]|nr:hypothetical protein S7335_2845 [Synechococcus sp. PCC 7335]
MNDRDIDRVLSDLAAESLWYSHVYEVRSAVISSAAVISMSDV